MIERATPILELFPGLSAEKAEIFARELAFIEATHGCTCACRMCYIPAPVSVKRYLPSQTISAIHTFIGKHDPLGTRHLSHHEAGQLSDYYDPETGWDMADVTGDCLSKTSRPVAIFLHGIDESDDRARNAAEKLWKLPEEMRRRVEIIVSTDPFGPINVPANMAEEIGRNRALNALHLFFEWPRLELRVFTPNYRNGAEEEEKVRRIFGKYTPDKLEIGQIQQPTRVNLPGVNHEGAFELCNGYGIRTDGSVVFKRFGGPREWPVIGSLTSIDPNKILPVSNFLF